jgi:hypothetical protein
MMDVAPVLVTAEAPRTAKLRAVPIGGAVCAHALPRQHNDSSRTAAVKSRKERLPQTMVLHSPSIHEFRPSRQPAGTARDSTNVSALEWNE